MNYIIFAVICISVILYPVRKLKRLSAISILSVFMMMILLYPADTIFSAKEGINLWLNVIIPSLLPFFIINDMLMGLRVPENISCLMHPVSRFLFNTSGYGAYVFVMSIFSGYPTGAKIVSQLIDEKKITPLEGQKILTFSSTSGPLFIIGAVGVGMYSSVRIGYLLYAAHISGAVVNGIFARLFFKSSGSNNSNNCSSFFSSYENRHLLSDAIVNSLYTCGIIGGYIIIFSCAIQLLDSSNFFKILADILKSLINMPVFGADLLNISIKSILEISNGVKLISVFNASITVKLIITSFIISFSGLSIIGQVYSIVNKTGISIKTYILFKATQAFFSSFICMIMLNLNPAVTAANINAYQNSTISSLIFSYILIYLVLIMFLNIIGSFAISKKSYTVK